LRTGATRGAARCQKQQDPRLALQPSSREVPYEIETQIPEPFANALRQQQERSKQPFGSFSSSKSASDKLPFAPTARFRRAVNHDSVRLTVILSPHLSFSSSSSNVSTPIFATKASFFGIY